MYNGPWSQLESKLCVCKSECMYKLMSECTCLLLTLNPYWELAGRSQLLMSTCVYCILSSVGGGTVAVSVTCQDWAESLKKKHPRYLWNTKHTHICVWQQTGLSCEWKHSLLAWTDTTWTSSLISSYSNCYASNRDFEILWSRFC